VLALQKDSGHIVAHLSDIDEIAEAASRLRTDSRSIEDVG
jgi:hypothetical protein